jgi:hypothetical protein
MTTLIELSGVFFGTFVTIFLPYVQAYLTALSSITNSSHATDRFWNECNHKMQLFFTRKYMSFTKNYARVSVRHQEEDSQESDGQHDRIAIYLHIHTKALRRKNIIFDRFKIIGFGLFVSLILSFASSLVFLATGQSIFKLSALGLAPLAISAIFSNLVFQSLARSLSESRNKVEDIIEESGRASRRLGFRTE